MTSTDPQETGPLPGDRVVVRFRKGAGAPGDWRRDPSATASDVTGVLVSSDAAELQIVRDGEPVRVPRALVMSIRVLSDRPVRNSEIRALESAAARGWPGTEHATVAGWLVRAGGGYTRRANSAVPLEQGATMDAESIAALSTWFDRRGLPTRCTVVERLIPAAHVDRDRIEVRAIVMTREISGVREPSGVEVVMADEPSEAWVAAVLAERSTPTPTDIGRAVLTASIDGTVGFASVVDGDGLVAVGRGAVTTDPTGTRWLGVSCLWTAPRSRGRGIGTALVDELVRWGAGHGSERVYLQVEADNHDAIRLYRRLGFARHHTYGYVVL